MPTIAHTPEELNFKKLPILIVCEDGKQWNSLILLIGV